jgi:hypothetical protein
MATDEQIRKSSIMGGLYVGVLAVLVSLFFGATVPAAIATGW